MKKFLLTVLAIKYPLVLAISIGFGALYGGNVGANPSIQASTPSYSFLYKTLFSAIGWDYTDDTVLTSLGSNDGTLTNSDVPDPIRRNTTQKGGASIYPNGEIEVTDLFGATAVVARINGAGGLVEPVTGAPLKEAGTNITITDHLEICVLTGSTC